MAGIISHLVWKDTMRLRVVLPMLTSWGDAGSKYWFKMRRNALNRLSGSFVDAYKQNSTAFSVNIRE